MIKIDIVGSIKFVRNKKFWFDRNKFQKLLVRNEFQN